VTDHDPFTDEVLDRYQPAVGRGGDWDDAKSRAQSGNRPERLIKMASRVLLGVAGVAAVAGLLALLIIEGPSSDPVATQVGDPASALVFPIVYPDPTYGIVTPRTELANLRGQVVVLAFIDDACEQCGTAADILRAASHSRATPLAVVSGVSVERARRFATAPITVMAPPTSSTPPRGPGPGDVTVPTKAYRGLSTAADPDGSRARALGVERLPTTVVIDRHGRVARLYDEVPTTEALGSYLERIARQAPPPDVPFALPPEPELAVFSEPTTVWNGVPRSWVPGRIACPYVPGSFRVAARGRDGEVLLLGQGLGRSLVTIARFGGTNGSSIGCGAPRTEAARQRALRQARARGFVSLNTGSTRGRFSLALVILDGYDRIVIDGVERPVELNGFIGSFPTQPSRVVIKGPTGERRIRLGPVR